MSVRVLRLAAVLLPTALLMHEGVYAVAGTGARPSHSYLELALPIIAALAASIALASLLLPLLSAQARRQPQAQLLTPLGPAAALVAVFVIQELTESLLLGGGPGDLLAALASGWLLAPLALLLGMLVSAAVGWLDLAEVVLSSLLGRGSRRPRRNPERRIPHPRTPDFAVPTPLAFGLARRPPPARGSTQIPAV